MDKPWAHLPRPWIADIGCGGAPAPFANILVDKFVGGTQHRNVPLATDGKLFVEGDIMALPFEDGELDFVYCNHLLEHLDRPDLGLAELVRVSPHGLAFVPGLRSEAMMQHAHPEKPTAHKWLCWRDNTTLTMMWTEPGNRLALLQRLTLLGEWPADWKGQWEELRICWGWGGWPSKPEIKMIDFVDLIPPELLKEAQSK